MVPVLLASLVVLGQGAATQAEFDRVGEQVSHMVNSKNFAGLARFYAPDCKFLFPDGQRETVAQKIAGDKKFFLSVARFSYKVSFRLVTSTGSSVQTTDTLVYGLTVLEAGTPHTYEYRTKADGTWRRGQSGWLLSAVRPISSEYKAKDAKWYPTGPYVPVVTAQPGGGAGPAPLDAFKKQFSEMVVAFDKKDLKAAMRPLAESYYMRDLQGNTHTREETIANMRRYFSSVTSVDYRSNFLIVSWTKDSAKITSSSYLGVTHLANGKPVGDETTQTATSWWVLSPSGWQLDHTVLSSTGYYDAQRHWHSTGGRS